MKTHLIKAFILLAFFIHVHCMAQNQKFSTESYTTEEGLSHNYVNAVVQDSLGFLWVATHNGLNRFDGHTFKTYFNNPSDTTSLISVHVESLLNDKAGNLWVGGLDGLEKYDKKMDRFIHISNHSQFREIKGIHVKVLLEDIAGNIWIGTNGQGLFKLNPSTYELKKYSTRGNQGERLSSDFINAIFQEASNELWIGCKQGGLNKLDLETNFISLFTLSGNEDINLSSIVADNKGDLLLGSWGKGLFKFSKLSQKIEHLNPLPEKKYLLENTSVVDIKFDRDGTLWLSTFDKGVVAYDGKTGKVFNFRNELENPYHIKSNIAWNIFEDKYGVVWVSTFGGGIVKIVKNDNGFKHISNSSQVIPSTFITSLFQHSDSTIFVSTIGKGAVLLNAKTNKLIDTSTNGISLTGQRVSAIARDSENNLWIATIEGIKILNSKTHETETLQLNNYLNKGDENFIAPIIVSIGFDGDWVWLGSFEGGLYKLNLKTDHLIHYVHNDKDKRSISNNVIWSIYRDHKGNMWFGTRNFLNRYDKESNTFIAYKPNRENSNSISHNIISQIFEDSEKNLWVATLGGGINKYRPKSDDFLRVTESEGLPEGHVLGVVEDRNGNFWLSTTKRICKYNTRTGEVFTYDRSSGLEDNTYNMNASLMSKEGYIYFGGSNGINYFHPDSIKNFNESPQIVFTGFKRFNKPVNVGHIYEGRVLLPKEINELNELVLNYDDYVISFDFSVLDFAYPNSNQYAYQLEGFDKDWINTNGKTRTAYYTNLSPGEYTLRIKATNHTGSWNPEEKKLAIIVKPPFWHTWWFRALGLLTSLIIVNIFFRLRVNSLKKQKRVLKRLVKKKTEKILLQNEVLEKKNLELRAQKEEILSNRNEILAMSQKVKEADERKTRFFTNISHEFRTPLTLILGPVETLINGATENSSVKAPLKLVYKNASRLLHLVNELMDFQKIDSGQIKLQLEKMDIIQFSRELVYAFEQLSIQRNIDLVFHSSSEKYETYFDPRKVEIILYNLISNAFKFTSSGGEIKIYFHINQEEDAIRIDISDNGIGIEEKNLQFLFDRYYQIENPELNKEGTGIGLAYSKELVELMKGKIGVQSQPGNGTTFTIHLPVIHLELSDIAVGEAPEIGAKDEVEELVSRLVPFTKPSNHVGADIIKATILIVEDNEDLRNYIKNCLEDKYEVLEAADGEEGLRIAREEAPKLILSDVMMPIMDGNRLCREVKNSIELSHIPIILLTAKSSLESQIQGYELGADDYVVKPFSKDLLLARIENLIKSRERLKELFKTDLQIGAKQMTVTGVDEKFLSTAISLVEENLSNADFGPAEMVKGIGMSRTMVHMKFKELTNLSTGEFIRIARLKCAGRLLKEQKLRVSEICYMVGFTDPNYFGKAFRALYGVSPSQYAEQD